MLAEACSAQRPQKEKELKKEKNKHEEGREKGIEFTP